MKVYHLIVFSLILCLCLELDLKAGVADQPTVKPALQVISSKIESEGKRVDLSRFENRAKISLDTVGWIKKATKKAALYSFGDSLYLVYKTRPTTKNKNTDSIFVYQCINFRKLDAQSEHVYTSNLAIAPASEQKQKSILDELMSPFVLVGVLFGGLLAVIIGAATILFLKSKKSKSNPKMEEDLVTLFVKVFRDQNTVLLSELESQLSIIGIWLGSPTDKKNLLDAINEKLKNKPKNEDGSGETKEAGGLLGAQQRSILVPEPYPTSTKVEGTPTTTSHRFYFTPEGENVLGPKGGDTSPKSNIHFFCLEWKEQETKAKVLLTLGELNTTNEVRVYDFSQNRFDRLKGYIDADGFGNSQVIQREPGEATLQNGQWVLTKPVKVLFG